MGDTPRVRRVDEVFRDVKALVSTMHELSRELNQHDYCADESFALICAASIVQTTLPENIFSDQAPTTGTVLAASVAKWEERNASLRHRIRASSVK